MLYNSASEDDFLEEFSNDQIRSGYPSNMQKLFSECKRMKVLEDLNESGQMLLCGWVCF